MDDVLSQIMLSGGDKNFRAGYAVTTIGIGDCSGVNQAEISASMRLGQAHCSGPGTRVEFWQVGLLELLTAVLTQRQGDSRRENRV